MSAGLLDNNPNPSRDDVREWFQKNRNACRCTGYIQITDAVMLAAKVLRGEEEMTDFSELLGKDGSVWGTRYPRPNAVYKATGTFDFGDDVKLKLPEGTLFAVPVCPETHHAFVKSIDLSEAEKMPGVHKIVTAEDIFANKGTNRIRGQVGSETTSTDGWERRILVPEGDKIRQWGEAVAIVCASTEKEARPRRKWSASSWRNCPVLSVTEAMKKDAPKVYDEIEGIDGMPNCFNKRPFIKGEDPAPLLKGPLRGRRGIPELTPASLDHRNRLRLRLLRRGRACYDPEQEHHDLRPPDDDRPRPGCPPSKIRVIQNNTGATFGYKVAVTNEHLIGACVIATGLPSTCA